MSTPARQTQPISPILARGTALFQVIAGRSPIGMTFSIASGAQARVGRMEGEISLSEDDEVSPVHATVSSRAGQVVIADNNSLNGVYVRVREPVALDDGDMFRVGAQLFRFDLLSVADAYPTPDGTQIFTSPRLKGSYRVLQILRDGLPGLSSSSSTDELSIGVEGARVNFTADTYLSRMHAKIIRAADGAAFLHDLGSTNGTWVRVRGDRSVRHGDQLLVGNTVLQASVH